MSAIHPTLRKLTGDDRRSIGRANDVAADVLANPRSFRVLFCGLFSSDPLIRMRAADALEKVTTQRPELLRSYEETLIRLAAATDQKEVRWHLAQMLSRLHLKARQRPRAVRILLSYLNDRSGIVRTCAMQALVDIARNRPALLSAVRRRITELTATGTPATKARGRKLLAQIGEGQPS